MPAYYNEHDPYAAEWLRNLIARGLIADGVVDERSIEDISPIDLDGFVQCHFFAGIGVWSRALRLAGVPDDFPIWTGSCPCQPFSQAGKGAGVDDERHLWPAFHWLIEQCRPRLVVGEQVASPAGLGWLDLVSADLEGSGYAVRAADLCAAGVGAPHIRQRLYWVADSERGASSRVNRLLDENPRVQEKQRPELAYMLADGGLAAPRCERRQQDPRSASRDEATHGGARRDERESDCYYVVASDGTDGGLADSDCWERNRISDGEGRERHRPQTGWQQGNRLAKFSSEARRPRATNGFWRAADWLFCRDGKWRPVRPGSFPLVDGAPSRVGRLRAYGNAIVPQVAAAFVRAALDGDRHAGEQKSITPFAE